jgi:hypothetical protein
MPVMEYDFRRYPSHDLSYPNNYNYDLLSIQHNSRPDPRGYPIGGPVGGRRRPGVGRDESVMENGLARCRVAVAVSVPTVSMAFTLHSAAIYHSFFALRTRLTSRTVRKMSQEEDPMQRRLRNRCWLLELQASWARS